MFDEASILTPGQALRQGVKLIECPFGILVANALDYLNRLSPPIWPALSSRDQIISCQSYTGNVASACCLTRQGADTRHNVFAARLSYRHHPPLPRGLSSGFHRNDRTTRGLPRAGSAPMTVAGAPTCPSRGAVATDCRFNPPSRRCLRVSPCATPRTISSPKTLYWRKIRPFDCALHRGP